jgi:glucose-1-phosphate adenylyltransferase
MGIYMFNTEVLCELLEHTDYDDFGKHAIPAAVDKWNVFGYITMVFGQYRDLRAFYEMNLELTDDDRHFLDR